MIYKVGLLGASGKMGLEIAALLHEGFERFGDQFELADAVTSSSRLTSIEGISTRRLTEPPREPVHVWIDFSSPEAAVSLLETIDTPVLIATTGFNEAQLQTISAYAEKKPVLLTSNTSIGMNLVMQLLQAIPSGLPFDTVMEETHHKHKKDAPSGTAKSLLGILSQRGYSDTPVTAIRAGGVRGEHSIRFIGPDEVVEIRHEALDRKIFAQGALVGASFLVKQSKPGIYSMQDALAKR